MIHAGKCTDTHACRQREKHRDKHGRKHKDKQGTEIGIHAQTHTQRLAHRDKDRLGQKESWSNKTTTRGNRCTAVHTVCKLTSKRNTSVHW